MFRRVVIPGSVVQIEIKTGESMVYPLDVLFGARFVTGAFFVAEVVVVHRHTVLRRALEDFQFGDFRSDGLNHLDAGRTCADDTDPLALEVNPLSRIPRGMNDLSLELFMVRKRRPDGRGKHARATDKKARLENFIGIIGVFIAVIVNIFLQSAMMDFVISVVGVLVFTGLTAYDVQKIKGIAGNVDAGSDNFRRFAILGALNLYLDFINMFIFMLRLMGGGRD